MVAWLGWSIFGIIALSIIAFAFGFVHYYKMRGEPSGVTGCIGIFSIVVTLFSLFLIPIDVYMVTEYKDHESYQDNMKNTYYSFYSIFMFCLFILIPFGYFYYEELGDIEDQDSSFGKRACAAMKYVIATALLWCALIVIGLFIDLKSNTSETGDSAWTHKVSGRFSERSDRIMPFCMAVITSIGMFFSMVYTAWGLASFPISLMKSVPMLKEQKSSLSNANDIQMKLTSYEKDLETLESRYRGKSKWEDRDSRKKAILLKKIKYGSLRLQRESSQSKSNSIQRGRKNKKSGGGFRGARKNACLKCETCCGNCARWFWNASAPVRYLVGMALFAFSLCVVVSVMLHLIDQAVNSSCGYSCGWALDDPQLTNYDPTSWMLSKCGQYFPMDYVFFSILCFWLFLCSVFGLVQKEVRFLCVKLFALTAHDTMHNALLMGIGFLILIVTSFNYLMYMLAPQYITYGRQDSSCDLDDPDCSATEIYYLISGILVGMPVFGLVYFVFSWVFVLVFMVSFVWSIYQRKLWIAEGGQKRANLLRSDSDDDLEAIFKN